MAAPWEKYQSDSSAGPWAKYSTSDSTPTSAESPPTSAPSEPTSPIDKIAELGKGIAPALGAGIGSSTGLGIIGEMAGRAVGANPEATLKASPYILGALGGGVGIAATGGAAIPAVAAAVGSGMVPGVAGTAGVAGMAAGAGVLGAAGAGLAKVDSTLMDKNTYQHPFDSIAALGKNLGPTMNDAANTQTSQELIGQGIGLGVKGAIVGTGKALELGGDVMKSAYRSLLGTVKGVGGKVIDRTLDYADEFTPTALNAAKGFLDSVDKLKNTAADNLSRVKSSVAAGLQGLKSTTASKTSALENMPIKGATEQDVVDHAVNYAKTLRSEAYAKSQEAAGHLLDTPSIEPQSVLDDIAKVREKFTVKGQAFGERANVVNTLDNWSAKIKAITEGSPDLSRVPKDLIGPDGKLLPNLSEDVLQKLSGLIKPGEPVPLSEVDLKGMLQGIKGDPVWKGPADQSTKQALRELYDKLSSKLDSNTSYKDALKPVHKMIDMAKAIEDAFGLERGADRVISQTDASVGRVKGMIQGTRAASEATANQSGLGDILGSAKGRQAASDARDLALKNLRKSSGEKIQEVAQMGNKVIREATAAAGVKYASDVSVLNMARAAVREGPSSGTYLKLVKTLSAVLGEKEGAKLAQQVVTSAASDIFKEGAGSAFPGGALRTVTSGLRNAPLGKLQEIDRFFQMPIDAGANIASFGRKFPGRGLFRFTQGLRDNNQ